jgi:toxin ParE1/3/4
VAEIIWTDEAERWLKDIRDYIVQDNPAAADKVISGIYQRAQILLEFPEVGYKYRSEPEGDIHILLYRHYRSAYLIKGSDHVDIIGVFHGALDLDRYLP